MGGRSSKADRAVAAKLKQDAAESLAERRHEADELHAGVEPLRDEIRVETPLALARVEAAGFPGARMLRLDRPRFFGRQYEMKAAWELEEHQENFKSEMVPTSTWLISDGRIMGGVGGSFREILAETTSEGLLQAILDGLRQLGA